MLCCGRKKDGHKEHPVEMATSPRRQNQPGPMEMSAGGTLHPSHHQQGAASGLHPLSSVATGGQALHSSPGAGLRSMVVQSDFRKVSGISTEIFRQIETVENDHDATTAAALEAVERRGEMLVRVLDPRQMGRIASEAARSFLTVQDPKHSVHFVEIVKRPGQTLGLYIREGNGIDRSDGVFISRIALESSVYNSGCLRVGDEILAINLVDVTRMSLDDVVIVMSIPRRLVLTTRQRRGPAGAVSPPPSRPEQKPPPVVVLKRGVQPEEPPEDNAERPGLHHPFGGPGSGGYGTARFLTTGKPLPGMADLPIHGTFPRGNRSMEHQQPRDLFREREAGRYPERAGDDPLHSGGGLRQGHDTVDHYYSSNYRASDQQQQYQQQPQQQQRYQPGSMLRSGGTLERNKQQQQQHSSTGDGMAIDSYRPPPPLIMDQSKDAAHFQQHHTLDRTTGFGAAKTLESLAERVHPFYGLQQGPGQQHQTSTIGRASTLGRMSRGGGNSGNLVGGFNTSGSGTTMSLMRGGRLTRSGSDQRIPVVDSGSDLYDYMRSKSGAGHYGTTGRADTAGRLGSTHTRRRTSIDYASDTEASTRSYSRNRYTSDGGSSGSWKAPPPLLGLGLTPTTPTAGTFQPSAGDSRSNSLPRGMSGTAGAAPRFRREVHFEQTAPSPRPLPSSALLHHHLDSQEDSDGAVSAPELNEKQKQLQRLSQQHHQLLYGRSPGGPGSAAVPGLATIGNFTSAEYKDWMQRAPSTSAIYERLRQGREALEAHRKLTFSAENLVEKSKQELPYYSYRSHLNAPSSATSTGRMDDGDPTALLGKSLMLGGRSSGDSLLQSEANRSVGTTIPQPTPGNSSSLAGTAGTAAKPNDPRFKLLEINPAEFIKYRSERPNGNGTAPSAHQIATASAGGTTTPSIGGGGPGPAPGGGSEEGVSGLLWIHLMAGRGLRSTSSRLEPVRDLYCVLECDRAHKARTVIRSGDVNFDWDETFDLDLVVNRELDFLIYSWDPQLRHRLCFKGSLHLVPLVRESPVHQVALKVEPRGTLYLKLRYTEPRTAFRRSPAARKTPPPLFGVDLETVVNREGSGLTGGVPILVQKCIEEVERRGMDIVGLYRLCGSATKKRILRESFERNPRLVDLSPDSVPDINVITGLLKEYLRELPEPLLTKCLYQMLVDALAVCLPDDPEGNAKLMFSILECLPKGNRTTLFLLMDHLCLVTAQSDRNKMTPQNLAICFGPVLMLHSEETTTSSATASTAAGGSLDFQKPIGVLKYLLQIWPMKSARAVEAAATASSTLRRLQLQQQLQLQPPQPPSSNSISILPDQPATQPTSSSINSSNSSTSAASVPSATAASAETSSSAAASAMPTALSHPVSRVADRKLDLPPLPPRPAPKVLQPRVPTTTNTATASSVKSPRALVGGPMPLAGGASSDQSVARGEADGSPAPLSTDSLVGAGSETPSLTSPTSSTASLSPVQPQQQSVASKRPAANNDYISDGADRHQKTINSQEVGDPLSRAGDDTDHGDSDLESPN